MINYHGYSNKIRIFSFCMLEIRRDNYYFVKGLLNFLFMPSSHTAL